MSPTSCRRRHSRITPVAVAGIFFLFSFPLSRIFSGQPPRLGTVADGEGRALFMNASFFVCRKAAFFFFSYPPDLFSFWCFFLVLVERIRGSVRTDYSPKSPPLPSFFSGKARRMPGLQLLRLTPITSDPPPNFQSTPATEGGTLRAMILSIMVAE